MSAGPSHSCMIIIVFSHSFLFILWVHSTTLKMLYPLTFLFLVNARSDAI
jgi:hypothetical protein